MQMTEHPKDDHEYDNRREYAAAELPGNKTGEASARGTFHNECSFPFIKIVVGKKSMQLLRRFN
jgi:hypothetical protein